MQAYYNPLDKNCKSVIGAVEKDIDCLFHVKADTEKCTLVLLKDGGKVTKFNMRRCYDGFEINLALHEVGLYFYTFDLGNGLFLGLGKNYSGMITENPTYFQLSVYETGYTAPDFLSGGIIYQIFPDRFAIDGKVKNVKGRVYHDDITDLPYFLPDSKGKIKNVDFFGGNLKGIIKKLPYLHSLGVTTIYLNPIFKAFSNHRYDTGDYFMIDENLGTEEDLVKLIESAKKLGISIILDGVFSHTGDDSRYFNKYGNYDSVGAYQSKDSPYYKWYTFKNFPDKYESWWGIDVLPEVKENNPSYNKFINGENGVIEHYTKLGIGGWRLDVADELTTDFLINLRKAVKRINPNAIIIGEVWEDATNKVSYNERRSYFLGNQLDSVMNYELKDAILDFVKYGNSKKLAFKVKEQIDHYPNSALHSLMNLLGTHDTYRMLTHLAGKNMDGKTRLEQSKVRLTESEKIKGKKMLKMATLLQYTLPGVPSIYYGDEIGMEGYSDPLNRKFFESDGIDEEILSWYRLLGNIRNKLSVFKTGGYYELYSEGSTIVYERIFGDDIAVVGVNNGHNTITLDFDEEMVDLLTGKVYKNNLELTNGDIVLLVSTINYEN